MIKTTVDSPTQKMPCASVVPRQYTIEAHFDPTTRPNDQRVTQQLSNPFKCTRLRGSRTPISTRKLTRQGQDKPRNSQAKR